MRIYLLRPIRPYTFEEGSVAILDGESPSGKLSEAMVSFTTMKFDYSLSIYRANNKIIIFINYHASKYFKLLKMF